MLTPGLLVLFHLNISSYHSSVSISWALDVEGLYHTHWVLESTKNLSPSIQKKTLLWTWHHFSQQGFQNFRCSVTWTFCSSPVGTTGPGAHTTLDLTHVRNSLGRMDVRNYAGGAEGVPWVLGDHGRQQVRRRVRPRTTVLYDGLTDTPCVLSDTLLNWVFVDACIRSHFS